ncbi:MAG: Sulfurtransferase [Candidatus Nomurabacteria bacterium GW2011_GWB1_43_20]|nr:MAG: Sulfurtransferase [Candidatus Nomurabacteria bacterium GW2011_GWB1_43_20]
MSGTFSAIIVWMNNISPKEAIKHIEDGNVIVVDVRTPAEFEGGHIGGALNIDISSMLEGGITAWKGSGFSVKVGR